MSETRPVYAPNKTAAFLAGAPPAERLHRARQTAGLLRDQHRLLRVVAENAAQAMTAGPVGLDERASIAAMLHETVGEMGELVQRLERELSLRESSDE